MTCGIYLLNFNNTDKVYIGQSISIEDRFFKHKSAFIRKAASPKLQNAYNTYGMPNLEILVECSLSELNKTEKEAIEIFNSVINGFNTLAEAGNPVLYGDSVGTSKYTNEQYKLVLDLLIQDSPRLSKREIESVTGVSIYTIRHIAALESHAWLENAYPEQYKRLKEIKINLKYYRGIEYPKLLSPDGEIHTVIHVTNFAKKHNLLQPKVTELLKGTRNVHKGWTRVDA